jgi:hypothetical protein
LVLTVGLQWLGAHSVAAPAVGVPPPAELLPRVLAGWQVADRPVADSPEEKAAVSELLNYDDAVFRIYGQGPAIFAVYLAHWNPGRMSPRLVAAHVPDVCWPAAGWERNRAKEQLAGAGGLPEAKAIQAMEQQAGLEPGQFRVFDGHGVSQNVLFWHVYGDEVINYDTQYAPPWYAMFSDVVKHGLNQRREQWFIRISSTVPLSALAADTGFQFVLSRLAAAGLKLPTPTAPR